MRFPETFWAELLRPPLPALTSNPPLFMFRTARPHRRTETRYERKKQPF
jgi:hypothetical protein